MGKKIPFNSLQKFIEIITVAVLVTMLGHLIIAWGNIPDQIPSHYNAAGVVDAYSGKGMILIMPIVGAGLYILMTVISFFPSVWNTPVKITEKNYLFVYQNIRSLLGFTKLALVITFAYITYKMAKAESLGPEFLPFTLVALFVPMIWYIVKIAKGNKRIIERGRLNIAYRLKYWKIKKPVETILSFCWL